MNYMADIMEITLYSFLGILLMALGNFLIDLVIPCSFPEEIKKRNNSVGFVSAGTNIGIGILLKAAISSPESSLRTETLGEGLLSSIIYFVIGIIFFMLGYMIIGLINRKYNINEEISSGNTAAGIMVAGIFIGLAITISGVIM